MQKISLEKVVKRARDGLGHPEQERFPRFLCHGKPPPEVLEAAKNLRRSMRQACKLPDPGRQGAPLRESTAVNDPVGVDTVHLRNHEVLQFLLST